MSTWDDEAGYDRRDPKHPGWAESMAYASDLRRKEERESQPEDTPPENIVEQIEDDNDSSRILT